jgi:CubicO group peptidase (beta-lactamase class C family)
LNDLLAGGEDSVATTLALPFVHKPGTYFEYAQTTVTVVGAIVAKAVGEDLQTFADQQLFIPLGIPRARWTWARDNAGNTQGYAFLSMAPVDLAKIGALLLHRGEWGGRQLIDPGYIDQMTAASPTNGGYGFLVWTNQGDSYITPSELARDTRNHRWVQSAPPDLFALSGLFDQDVWVIPSLDMVVVRTGGPGSDPWVHEFFRYLMRGVEDQHIPDPGPAPAESDIDLSNWDSLADFASLPGFTLPPALSPAVVPAH